MCARLGCGVDWVLLHITIVKFDIMLKNSVYVQCIVTCSMMRGLIKDTASYRILYIVYCGL